MPKIAKPFNEAAAKVADEEFYRKHPDRKLKPLTSSPSDGHLRDEWLELYKRHGGQVRGYPCSRDLERLLLQHV